MFGRHSYYRYSTPYDGHDYWKYVAGKIVDVKPSAITPRPPQRCRLTNMRSINRNR